MKTAFPSNENLARELREDVARICLPYGRMVGTKGHDDAEAYLLARLTEIGCVPYRGDSIRLSNEHTDGRWVSPDAATQLLTHAESRRVLLTVEGALSRSVGG